MILEDNGISLEVIESGPSFTYKVLDQTEEATNTLRHLKVIGDDRSIYTLRSNKHPSFNKEKKRFFLRGMSADKNNKRVRVDCSSIEEAQSAIGALRRLISKVVKPELVSGNDVRVRSNPQYTPGGTAHVRFRFINRNMAQVLKLTGKDHYPVEKLEWVATEPVFTLNTHYNEHIAQAVDVLNKSIDNPAIVDGVINPDKVTPQQAKAAVELLDACFDKALKEDFLIAWWRMVTGIRGPDFVPCPRCGKEC